MGGSRLLYAVLVVVVLLILSTTTIAAEAASDLVTMRGKLFIDSWRDRVAEITEQMPFRTRASMALADFALYVLEPQNFIYRLRLGEVDELVSWIYENWPEEPSEKIQADHDSYWALGLLVRLYGLHLRQLEAGKQGLNEATAAKLLEIFWRRVSAVSKIEDSTELHVVYGSENHDFMRKGFNLLASMWLAQDEEYAERAYEHGGKAADHYRAWREWFFAYVAFRAREGLLAEVASPCYGQIYLEPMLNLYDFGDSLIRKAAQDFLDLYWALYAIEQIDGVRGGAKVRSYKVVNSENPTGDNTRAFFYFLTGIGTTTTQYLQLHPATTSYRMHPVVESLARSWEQRGVYNVVRRIPGEGINDDAAGTYILSIPSHFVRTTYCTPDFVLGALVQDPNRHYTRITEQNRWFGAIFATGQRVFVEACYAGHRDNTYYDMRGIHAGGTVIAQLGKEAHHASHLRIFVTPGVKSVNKQGWMFAELGNSYMAVTAAVGTLQPKFADGYYVVTNGASPVIIQVVRKNEKLPTFEDFCNAVLQKGYSINTGVLTYTDLETGSVIEWDLSQTTIPKINGETVDLDPELTYDSPFVQGSREEAKVRIMGLDGEELIINFSYED